MKKAITTLLAIPEALFEKFAGASRPRQYGEFTGPCGWKYSITTCPASEAGKNGPFTLVYENRPGSEGRFRRSELRVYAYPAKAADFGPDNDGFNIHSLAIKTFLDDPTLRQTDSRDRWEDGKGFWIPENLTAEYGEGKTRITSKFDDWEFGFLLKLQMHAHEIAKGVASRGYWQVEINPTGNYSQKPGVH